MTYRSPTHSLAAAIVADSADGGAYTVPSSLTDVLAKEAQIKAALAIVSGDSLAQSNAASAEATAATDAVADLLRDGSLPDDLGRDTARLVDDARAAQARANVLRSMIDDIQPAIEAAAYQAAPVLIVDHLRPAEAEVLDQVRTLAPAYQAGDRSNALVDELRALAARFRVIHGAFDRARRLLPGPKVDTGGTCMAFRDPTAVWGASWAGRHQTTAVPWPRDEIERLIWMATDDVAQAQGWLPLPDEQDEAYEAMPKARLRGRGQLVGGGG